MNTDEIFKRYWDALGSEPMTVQTEGALVRFALRLAVQDAYDAGAALCNDMARIIAAQQDTISARDAEIASMIRSMPLPDHRQAEADRAQMALIAEWLAENEPALYYGERGGYGDAILEAVRKRDAQIAELQGEIAKVDADNADLLRTLKAAHDGWNKAQTDADRLALRVAQQPAEIHVNGNSAEPAFVDDWRFYLSEQEREYLESLETGRRRFGSLERSTRLAIVQAFARGVGNGLAPTQAAFDAAKPAWMPGAGGIAAGFGAPWAQILDLDPATVQR